jgi:hypothetical protein
MATQNKPSSAFHIILWVVQLVLAISFIWSAGVKLTQPISSLSAIWPWTGQISAIWVRVIGALDLLGAVGLIVPALLRIKPIFTPIAASSIVVLMVCASVFHIIREETSLIGVNVGFALMAAWVAWGRFAKVPIMERRTGAADH